MTRASRWLTLSWMVVAMTGAQARGEDHFFTFGGGYAPEGNQVSLESNVAYFRRVLRDTGHADDPQCTLFADGDDPGRDLQFSAGQRPEHRLGYLLAAVFQETDDIFNEYRTNALPDLDGPCTPDGVDRYFNETACHLGAGDRLLIYYTGHGGRGEKREPQNTSLELWDHRKMRVKEFAERLDRVPAGVPVVVVMVQCFSGGFANVIFQGADPEGEPVAHNRAGFFATVFDRTAAGCTPDIDEANYQEYSSFFFAALCGRDRLDAAVERPDFDLDGRVSFDEAHAYALIHSDSIDVSVKTSDAFLRRYSRTKPTDEDRAGGIELLSEDAHFPALAAAAGPNELAVLGALGAALRVTDVMRTTGVRARAASLEERRDRIGDAVKRSRREYKEIAGAIAAALKARWPELDNPWHPRVAGIITEHASDLLGVIEGHEKYSRFTALGEEIDRQERERLNLERQWAKCQRFIRTAENVALAANLEKVAAPEIRRRFAELLAAEHGTLE